MADAPQPGLHGPNACDLDVVEIAPLRGRLTEMQRLIEAQGASLPAVGHMIETDDHSVLCVRPGRWLWLEPREEAGTSAASWERACAGITTVVDLSSALTVLALAGPAVRQVLARGCRLDLDPSAFPPGRAARTIMAQVPVILARRASGVLLLTPSTTAQHFIEWCRATAKPFELEERHDADRDDFLTPAAGAHQA